MVTLQNIVEQDFDNIYNLTSQLSVMKYVGNGKTWDKTKVETFIKYNVEEQQQDDKIRQNYYYKVVKKDEFIGIIGFHIMNNKYQQDKNIRYQQLYLTTYFDSKQQGKGYYSKAFKLLLEKIKTHKPYCRSLFSLVRSSNDKMNLISKKQYKFIRQVKLSGTLLNEYVIPVNDYEAIIESEYFSTEQINKLLTNRGNWGKIDYDSINCSDLTSIDFIYVDGMFIQDKQIQNIKSNMKNIIGDGKKKINEKDNLYNNLLKLNDDKVKQFMMPQYSIDLNKVVKKQLNLAKYEKLFNNDVWIFKPVGGWSGEGIKVFNNFQNFQEYCFGIISDNKHKWKQLNTTKHVHKLKLKNEWVLQKYITKPQLFNHKKFHIRYYYLYTYINNTPKSYVYPKGNIYTAKQVFMNDYYDDKDIHDTHLGSTDDDYVFPDDSKMDTKTNDYIMKQIMNITRYLSKVIKGQCYSENVNCFELFGVDVIITNNNKVKLLEVNSKIGMKYIKDNKFFVDLLDNVFKLTMDQTFFRTKDDNQKSLFIDIHHSTKSKRKSRKTKRKSRKTRRKITNKTKRKSK